MRAGFRTQSIPTLAAAAVLVLLLAFGAAHFEHFASAANLSNLVGDYAYVGIAAIGATFVILSGGIDLSVGSMVAFVSVVMAALIGSGWHPLAAEAVCLAIGAMVGAAMGGVIRAFELPAFMVTLAGMFMLRAAGFLVAKRSTGIGHPFLGWVSDHAVVESGGVTVPLRTMLLVIVAGAAVAVAGFTRLGRSIYALGGSERSARAMGVPVGATRVAVYSLAGLCSALAGVVLTMDRRAGDPASSVGLELDVIAAVVIGGTLLIGGVGSIWGTLIGVLILGAIRMLIVFEGNLNAAWTSVAIGMLLLGFIVLQRLVAAWSTRSAKR